MTTMTTTRPTGHATFCHGHEPAEPGTEAYPCASPVAQIGVVSTWVSDRGIHLIGIPALGTVLSDDDAEELLLALAANVEARRAARVPSPRRPMDDEVGR